MGTALSALFAGEGAKKHRAKRDVIWEHEHSGLLPLDAREGAIFQAADESSRYCYRQADRLMMVDATVEAIRQECDRRGVPHPQGEDGAEIIRRGVDRAWWLRSLRKAHSRRFEHAAIQLGFTNYRAGPYVSHETAIRQARRNQQNAKLLASVELQNELGQTFTLAELADLGTANKAIRRGELMTRIRGFEEIAFDLGHVGLFWTQTAPSKYHAVLSKSGEPNPKYIAFGSPTPRDAQEYLVHVWALQRAALHRAGIRPYGIRIAEPHHDGCPHWHMLLFVSPKHAERMERILRKYALAEDFGEWAREENRAKLVRIESGAVAGKASGYIAKYVAKNIDGEHVGDHHMHEDGRTYIVAPDMLGNQQITPSQRVTYWSQTWGIRQFQQIGGAPVGVWRELRRIKAETVAQAPEAIRAAHQAVQKIDGGPEIAKQASWADYLRAMGGPAVGRNGAIQLARRTATIEGRYATYDAAKPCGVYHIENAAAVYESVRYQWKPVTDTRERGQERCPARLGSRAGFGVPWTGVNNCTDIGDSEFVKASADLLKNQKICSADWDVRWNPAATPPKLQGRAVEGFPDQSEYVETYSRHRKDAARINAEAHARALKAKYEH